MKNGCLRFCEATHNREKQCNRTEDKNYGKEACYAGIVARTGVERYQGSGKICLFQRSQVKEKYQTRQKT